jgi:GxxExxY protein
MTRISARMNTDQNQQRAKPMKHEEVTKQIIAAFYHVYNALGWGFLEKVYHNALKHELEKRGLKVESQARFEVYYDGLPIGEFFTDLLIEGRVILELKSAEGIAPEHEAQLLNHLRASGIDVGLVLNFGPKPQIKRKIYDTARRTVSTSTISPGAAN